MITIQELLAVLNQIPAAVEKALTEALILRHPGHGSQKVHGNRYGGFSTTKESLRRLKGDKGAREAYKATARKREARKNAPFGQSRSDYTPDYHEARTVLKSFEDSLKGVPESEWGEIDRDFITDARLRVQEELQLSRAAKEAGYTPGKMTKEEWGEFGLKARREADSQLRHAYEAGRESAGERARGKKDIWMQVGGQAVLARSGVSKKEARNLVSQLGAETKDDADNFMTESLTKFGYDRERLDQLSYSQKRRLIAEIGHGQRQSGTIGNITASERQRVIDTTSEIDRLGARSTSMNPRAGRGFETWTYYEQAALKAGQEPDIIPDYLMDIEDLPDYVRYPGGKNPYTRPKLPIPAQVEEFEF